jgi:hypothetical protein
MENTAENTTPTMNTHLMRVQKLLDAQAAKIEKLTDELTRTKKAFSDFKNANSRVRRIPKEEQM